MLAESLLNPILLVYPLFLDSETFFFFFSSVLTITDGKFREVEF